MDLITVKDITVQEGRNKVLSGISFSQKPFEKIAICGETGAGKSSLLKIIAGLAQPDSGAVYFKGQRVKGPQEVLVPGQPGMAYLTQDFDLPQFLRVEQVLAYANTLEGKKAEKLFKLCRINHLLSRKTNQLSGGERQRIALARLLLRSPEVLLLDEPFSNLDSAHKTVLKKVLEDVSVALGITQILISHDPLDTLSWADKILVMKAGNIIQTGPPEEVYRKPKTVYTAGLFGSFNLIPEAKAGLFPGLEKRHRAGRNYILRPEDFIAVSNSNEGVQGTVKQVKFYGSYYEVNVAFSEFTVTLKSETNVETGSQITVALKPEKSIEI